MPPIDNHIPGSFCWFELATSDQGAAKQFYQSLFGWTATDTPIGPSEFYTTFKVGGRDAAAAYTMRKEQQAHGMPPNWMVYVRVENADATAQRAAELGGTMAMPPFDVMDHGRMAVLQDPTGAMLSVWQPNRHAGTGVVHEPGTAVWADLSTPDQDRASQFYRDLFGWKMVAGKSEVTVKPGTYAHIVNGDDFIGGIPPAEHRDPKMPAHWMIYFSVPECGAAIAKATSLGARVLYGPMTIESARTFAVLGDPQGAVFAIVDSRH